MKYRYY